jgi:predicted nucleotidyltransferase
MTVAQQGAAALLSALGESLVAVVLFGSRASGDARVDSDWDLLVIAHDLPQRPFERHKALKRALPELVRGDVAIVARTPHEFEMSLPSLYLDIALDGRILYDPSGYAAEKLDTLRSLIQRKGLARRRSADGDVWVWPTAREDRWQLDWAS